MPPPTKTSTPRISDLAREVRAPKGATSTGWPAVRDKCADLGITFRPWQPGVGQLILAKRADGKYAATIGGTGLSIPRQVGKTFLVGAIVFALCLLNPNLTVIWTAHRLRTAEETFGKMQKFAKRRRIAPHILKLVLGSGEEAVLFRNGSRILFGARESGFGLGFDEVDVLIFDEAQRLRDMTLDDMIPATNQSRQPTSALLLFMGTPPRPTDSGEVFTRMRTECLSGEDEDTGWVEFGADPGYVPTPLPAPFKAADWEQVAKANPSYPLDTSREAILRMRKKLGADSLLREGFGIWDPEAAGKLYSPDDWRDCANGSSRQPRGSWTLALDVNPRASAATVAAVGTGGNGKPLVFVHTFANVADVVPFLERQNAKRSIGEIALHPQGQSGALLPDLKKAGLEKKLHTVSTTHLGQSCGAFLSGIKEHTFEHAGQPELTTALQIARTRRIGQGEAEMFAEPRDEITPVIAASVALYRYGMRRTQPSDFR